MDIKGKQMRGFPYKGWEFVDCEDMEYDRECCEACERQIRYIHILRHDDYNCDIRVGCECAKKLSLTYDSSEAERVTKQKYTFIKSPRWKVSVKGNPHIKINDYHITIINRKGWAFVIQFTRHCKPESVWGDKYKTEVDAKKAAFDKIGKLKKEI